MVNLLTCLFPMYYISSKDASTHAANDLVQELTHPSIDRPLNGLGDKYIEDSYLLEVIFKTAT